MDHSWSRTNAVAVSEEQNTSILSCGSLIGLNPVATAETAVHALDESNWTILDIRSIVFAHDLLDGLGGFIGIVEWNGADIVVKNMSLDNSVEKLSSDKSEFSINGRCGSSSIIPAFRSIVRKRWISVLKIGDGNQPVVDPKIRKPVPDKHVGPSEFLTQYEQSAENDGQTKIAEKNQFGVFGFVQRAVHVEMVDTFPETVLLALATTLSLVLVVIVTGDIGDDIQRPANELLTNEFEERHDWSFLNQLVQFVGKSTNLGGILFSGLGYENHISFHIASGLVMLAVGNLPGEVGDKK